ncbi:Hypothetical predicted protein [Octopus vulgaris]|uniref:Uncharacterized protein n=1 Tax=Octopus vulgaris TaxID=6645 RepID=A0AA36BIN0_OCTVU|nr:Hypothetical predicted protein [Octopus vulgaris]
MIHAVVDYDKKNFLRKPYEYLVNRAVFMQPPDRLETTTKSKPVESEKLSQSHIWNVFGHTSNQDLTWRQSLTNFMQGKWISVYFRDSDWNSMKSFSNFTLRGTRLYSNRWYTKHKA